MTTFFALYKNGKARSTANWLASSTITKSNRFLCNGNTLQTDSGDASQQGASFRKF